MSELEDIIENETRKQHDTFTLNKEDRCPKCGGPLCWYQSEGRLKTICACELLEKEAI